VFTPNREAGTPADRAAPRHARRISEVVVFCAPVVLGLGRYGIAPGFAGALLIQAGT
jgi:hypothetical protein